MFMFNSPLPTLKMAQSLVLSGSTSQGPVVDGEVFQALLSNSDVLVDRLLQVIGQTQLI